MNDRYQLLLQQLLDKEPLKSTWYYQDTTLAAIEQAVYEAMLFDELFDEHDVVYRLGRKGWVMMLDKVRDQLSYMALDTREKRLIFREVLLSLYDNFRQMLVQPQQAARILQEGLMAIALENGEMGKIGRYVDEYVYVPKMLLLLIADRIPEGYTDDQRQKLSQMKPKFAKYYFNCALEMLLTNPAANEPALPAEKGRLDSRLAIEEQLAEEMPEKCKVYGRIK